MAESQISKCYRKYLKDPTIPIPKSSTTLRERLQLYSLRSQTKSVRKRKCYIREPNISIPKRTIHRWSTVVIEQDKAGITNDHAVLKGDGRDMVQLSCSEGTDDSDYNVGGDGGSGVDDDDNGGVGCYNGEGGSGDGDDGSGDKCGGISCDMYDGGNDHGDGGNNDNDSDNDDDSGGDGDNGSDDDGECFDGCGSVDIEYNDDHSDNGDRDGHIGYGDDVHDDGGHGDDHGDSDDHVDDHGDGDEHGDSDDHGDDHGDGGDHDDVHDDDDHGDDHDDGDDHGDYHGDGDDHGDYHGDSDDHATKGVGMVQQVSTVQKNKLPTSPLYLGAPISMKASWFACNYFARTNNLSDGATKQLLDLVAIHCIDKNNCAKSTYVLRKRLEIDVQSEIKKFCSQCFKEIKDTNNCICSQKKSTICYLIFLPFDKHMVNIFEEKWNVICQYFNRTTVEGTIQDIHDASI